MKHYLFLIFENESGAEPILYHATANHVHTAFGSLIIQEAQNMDDNDNMTWDEKCRASESFLSGNLWNTYVIEDSEMTEIDFEP